MAYLFFKNAFINSRQQITTEQSKKSKFSPQNSLIIVNLALKVFQLFSVYTNSLKQPYEKMKNYG